MATKLGGAVGGNVSRGEGEYYGEKLLIFVVLWSIVFVAPMVVMQVVGGGMMLIYDSEYNRCGDQTRWSRRR